MSTHRLAVVPGDGVGVEVTAEAVKAVEAAADRFGFGVETTDYDLGGDRYLRTGDPAVGIEGHPPGIAALTALPLFLALPRDSISLAPAPHPV